MTVGAGPTRRELGDRGEELAARWYRGRGYEVLDRNWRCRRGELDLVVRADRTIVFCEVKVRTTDRFGSGAESVVPAKRQRLRRVAVEWLTTGGGQRLGTRHDVRFDVVSITGGRIVVVEDAF